ncbi:RDD family protein [Nonomuraea sp. NPDC046802]|uniref:RDD family protein n=1 Tax=Nonomuraea sp. NPDC046802 TaxID=3154919 RepID=UPI0033E92AC5
MRCPAAQWAYWVLPVALSGLTAGKWLMNTRIVDATTGGTPGYWRATLRFFVFAPSYLLVFPMLIVGLIAKGEPRHRTLWDFAGRTCVIKLPPKR